MSDATSGPVDLQALATELAEQASSAHAGRAARTLPHPIEGLRQTLIALRAGAEMSEHESPGPASLMVVRGRVSVVAGDTASPVGANEMSPVPDERHSLRAEEDSIVLLSVAVRGSRKKDSSTGARRNVGG
jgi:quercetin dioxygenase-like cupin family protein